MKGFFLLFLPVLLFISCKKEKNFPIVDTITKGSKWGLEIGSSYAAIYSQLQALGKEKNFDQVGVAYRQSFSKPQEIEHIFGFYRFLTLQNNTGVIDRVIFEFPADTVTSISSGGALPTEISKWPEGVSDEVAIHENEPVEGIYAKLLAIYQIPAYSNYIIILPDKTLEKPFDPDMVNYDEWGFSMSNDVRPGIRGTSAVSLFFKDGKLNKIRDEYSEGVVYN